MKFRILLSIFALTLVAQSPANASTSKVPAPMSRIAPALQRVFTCIIYHESTSTWAHLNTGDNRRSGSSGIFQITPQLWNRWAPLVEIHVPIWEATVTEQMRGAIEIYRHDGWVPWKADWMCLP